MHLLGQAADVVVRLDRDRRAAKTNGLNNIRVERALDEPFNITDLFRLSLEYINEFAADRFTFFLGFRDAVQGRVKLIARIDAADIQVQIVLVKF